MGPLDVGPAVGADGCEMKSNAAALQNSDKQGEEPRQKEDQGPNLSSSDGPVIASVVGILGPRDADAEGRRE